MSCLYIALSKLLTFSRVKAIENNKSKILSYMSHKQMVTISQSRSYLYHTRRKCTCKINCCYCFHIPQNYKSIDRQTTKGSLSDSSDVTSVLGLTLLCFDSFTHPRWKTKIFSSQSLHPCFLYSPSLERE